MVAADKSIEVERAARECRQHAARPAAATHGERLAIAPAADLDSLSGANEVVVGGIHRIHHPHPAVLFGAEYQEVTILSALDVHASSVARQVPPVRAEPEAHRRIGAGIG